MNTEDDEKKCSACGGSGVNKANLQDMNEVEKNGGIEYSPAECQHCKGSGKEPD